MHFFFSIFFSPSMVRVKIYYTQSGRHGKISMYPPLPELCCPWLHIGGGITTILCSQKKLGVITPFYANAKMLYYQEINVFNSLENLINLYHSIVPPPLHPTQILLKTFWRFNSTKNLSIYDWHWGYRYELWLSFPYKEMVMCHNYTHVHKHIHSYPHTTYFCGLFSDADLCRPLPTVLLQPPLAAGGVFVRLFKLLFDELRLPLVRDSGLEPTAVPAPCPVPGWREGQASDALAACAESPVCGPAANRGGLLELAGPGSGRGGVCCWGICCCCCCCCCCATGELDFLLLGTNGK